MEVTVPEPVPDFWPANIGETTLITPASILKEEASYLGPKTKQLVKAEVRSSTSGDNFVQQFVIVAPGLNNYVFILFHVIHPITLYPATLVWQNGGHVIPNQAALTAKLKEILESGQTRQVIEALLAQVSGASVSQ
jgi:hypothetical protein